MKTIVEKTRIVKQTSLKTKAWLDGHLVEVYASGNTLNGSEGKIFSRWHDSDSGKNRVNVVRGKVYQDAEGKPYFLPF